MKFLWSFVLCPGSCSPDIKNSLLYLSIKLFKPNTNVNFMCLCFICYVEF